MKQKLIEKKYQKKLVKVQKEKSNLILLNYELENKVKQLTKFSIKQQEHIKMLFLENEKLKNEPR